MSLHGDWKRAKDKAKKENNGKAIVFKGGHDLGKALDNFEAAEKAYEKIAHEERNKKWAEAVLAYGTATAAATKIAAAYVQALPTMTLTNDARETLHTALVIHTYRPLKSAKTAYDRHHQAATQIKAQKAAKK